MRGITTVASEDLRCRIQQEVIGAPVQLWPLELLADRAWELGANATSYDAAYIALAERLDVSLVTHDGKLERVPGTSCTVEVF